MFDALTAGEQSPNIATEQLIRTRSSPICESDTLITRRKGPSIKTDASKCTGCLICELRCSLRFEKTFEPAMAAVQVRRRVQSTNEYEISFTDRCDNCGICVRYCSYGALTQEKRRR